MPPPAIKRIRLSMDQKIKIIEESLKPGFDCKKAALKYGISESSAYKIIKQKASLLSYADQGVKTLKSKKSQPGFSPKPGFSPLFAADGLVD